jgi:hypothetical protein
MKRAVFITTRKRSTGTMLTTVEEARGKWCPFVRVDGSNRFNNTKSDGFVNSPAVYHCIADECMMWRGFHGHLKLGAQRALHDHGFCALGIKPEIE